MKRRVLIGGAIAAVAVIVVAVIVGLSLYRSVSVGANARNTAATITAPNSLSGVVATAAIHSLAGKPTFSANVTVTAIRSSQSFRIDLTDVQGKPSPTMNLNLSTNVVTPTATCAPAGTTFSFGSITSKPMQSFPLPGAKLGGPGAENPSFYRDITLTDSANAPDNCVYPLVAFAPLHWTIGDIRPDIKVIDEDARPGAKGTIAGTKDKPLAYDVVGGDNLTVIAKRFNLTLEQLLYLNPTREPGPDSPTARAGEILNLSKFLR
jgi:hypothetical protein